MHLATCLLQDKGDDPRRCQVIPSQPLQWESPLSACAEWRCIPDCLQWKICFYLVCGSGIFADGLDLYFSHWILFPSGAFEPSHCNIISSFRTETLKHGSIATLVLYMYRERKREIILWTETYGSFKLHLMVEITPSQGKIYRPNQGYSLEFLRPVDFGQPVKRQQALWVSSEKIRINGRESPGRPENDMLCAVCGYVTSCSWPSSWHRDGLAKLVLEVVPVIAAMSIGPSLSLVMGCLKCFLKLCLLRAREKLSVHLKNL